MARPSIPENWKVPDKAAGRDPAEVARTIEGWMNCRGHLGGKVGVSDVTWPVGAGVSNETILFRAAWQNGSERRSRDLVIRIRPGSFQLFKDPGFDLQFRVLQVLYQGRFVKVAEPLWFEEDPAYFGRAFFVMARLAGRVPASYPPYNSTGWLFDAEPQQRAHLWRSSMRELSRIHSVPTDAVAFLNKPALGPTGFDQLYRYWLDSYDWAREGRAYPVLEAAREWLRRNLPKDRPTALSWGDSRIGNMMFDDGFSVVGVMDWEQVSLGGPLQDVGWWTYFDTLHSTSMGLKRLEGLGSLNETLALWQELTGGRIDDLQWYQVFAGFKVSIIVMRRLHITRELKPGYNVNNNVWTRLMAGLHGGPEPADIL